MRFKNVKKLFISVLVSGIFLSLFAFTACGGGGGGGGGDDDGAGIGYDPVDNSYAKTYKDGVPKDISELNTAAFTYTLITYLPSDKRESNSAPSAGIKSAWELITTDSSSLSIESSGAVKESIEINSLNQTIKKGLNIKQAECDLKMRGNENKAFSSKAPLYSKKIRGLYSKVPSSIIEGVTTWSVTIVITNPYTTIATTCKKSSAHAYIFVDDNDTMSSELLDEYASAFETIYAKNHEKFGTENDVDENGKIIIVFSKEITGGILGYFNSDDKFSAATYSDSNEGDIFYITTDNCDGSAAEKNTIKATLAHEFQHMIYFDQHYNRGVETTYAWLNEALSQAAEYYNSYLDNHEGWMASFLSDDPALNWEGLSLTYWTKFNYGYGAIFIRYIIDQYGDTAIKNMCSTGKVGIAAVEAATGDNFNAIFYNFSNALAISGTVDSSDPDYKPDYDFISLDLQVLQPNGRKGLNDITSSVVNTGFTYTKSSYPYEIFFIECNGDFGKLTLTGKDIVGTAFGLSQ